MPAHGGLNSSDTDAMPCPRCGSDQTRAKLLLLIRPRWTCSNCGVRLRVRGYELVTAVVRGGLVMLPVFLLLAWATSSWLVLALPLMWWLALCYLLLPSHDR